jgi:hypothetical protein
VLSRVRSRAYVGGRGLARVHVIEVARMLGYFDQESSAHHHVRGGGAGLYRRIFRRRRSAAALLMWSVATATHERLFANEISELTRNKSRNKVRGNKPGAEGARPESWRRVSVTGGTALLLTRRGTGWASAALPRGRELALPDSIDDEMVGCMSSSPGICSPSLIRRSAGAAQRGRGAGCRSGGADWREWTSSVRSNSITTVPSCL